MVENIEEQGKKLNTNNIKKDFYKHKESSYRTQWRLAFEQSQYLEQNKNKPRPKLLNSNTEIPSYNKRII